MRWLRHLSIGLLAAAVVGCAAGAGESRLGAPAPSPVTTPTDTGAPASPPAAARTVEKIVVALPSAGGVFAPHYLAQQQGFFAEEGLEAEIAVMRGNLGPAGLASGQVHYTGTISGTVRDAINGVPHRVIAATVDKSTRRLMAVPGISSVEQVRGKTIAVAAIGDGIYNSGVAALEQLGIDPHSEVTWLQVGGIAERYLTLQQGGAQVSIFSGPEVPQAEALGFRTVLHLNDVAPLPESGLSTHLTTLETKPQQVRQVLRAMVRSLQFLKSNRGGSLPVFAQLLGVTPEEAAPVYDAMLFAYSADGTLSERALRFTIESEKRQLKYDGEVSPAAVADFGPLYQVLGELGVTPAADSAR